MNLKLHCYDVGEARYFCDCDGKDVVYHYIDEDEGLACQICGHQVVYDADGFSYRAMYGQTDGHACAELACNQCLNALPEVQDGRLR